jgi:hypothetical protein
MSAEAPVAPPPAHALPPEAAAAELVIQIGIGHLLASALQVVVRLGVPDLLAEGARTPADLATQTGTQADPLRRVLRALASVGLFEEDAQGRYGLTVAGRMLRRGVPGSMFDMALWITSPFHFRTYAELMHSVKTGQPAGEKVAGMPVFEYLAKEPELSAIFNNAMSGFSEVAIAAALDAYDFGGHQRIVDVAGGHGAVLTAILRKNPGTRGVLFDLEHVLAGAGPRLDASGVADRVEVQHGDFFKAVPAGGDAYVMKHIIHDWDDARATTILKNIATAMGDRKGTVILLENVLPAGNAPDFGKILDLEMLVMPGGRERTADEFKRLFAGAGFELTRIVPTRSPLSVVEARRT